VYTVFGEREVRRVVLRPSTQRRLAFGLFDVPDDVTRHAGPRDVVRGQASGWREVEAKVLRHLIDRECRPDLRRDAVDVEQRKLARPSVRSRAAKHISMVQGSRQSRPDGIGRQLLRLEDTGQIRPPRPVDEQLEHAYRTGRAVRPQIHDAVAVKRRSALGHAVQPDLLHAQTACPAFWVSHFR
jgi:hypothetical protein